MNIPQAVRDADTIPKLFFAQAAAQPARFAYEHKTGGQWHRTSFGEYANQVLMTAQGLRTFGVGPGDGVAIWGNTLPDWTICDLAAMTCGGHTTGIYQTSTVEQAAYVLNDCRAKVCFVDTPERLELMTQVRRRRVPELQHVVLWQGQSSLDALTLEQLQRDGQKKGEALEALLQLAQPSSLANLVYTSGTTGPPKGVMLDQENLVACCRAIMDQSDLLREDDTTVSYLPLSHVAEHVSFLARLYAGIGVYFCPDMNELGPVMREKSPTYIFGVPRVFEKIQHKIMHVVEKAPPRKQRIMRWALEVGRAAAEQKLAGQSPGMITEIQHRVADRLVLSKMREALGGRLRFVVSGAAPMDVEGILFFESLGISFIEAYGLSESGGVSHINRATAKRAGTVGLPTPMVEASIAEDGEVLLRGPMIFRGYLNKPEATAEVLDEEGWLHTGDIGEIDADGFLRITDRKKNLIITAGGKNIAPSGIEALIKREPLIAQVVIVGDRKPYLIALISVSHETVELENLAQEEVEERVAAAIAAANTRLARYEQIKRFKILPQEFSIEGGEMTPTMKVRRKQRMVPRAGIEPTSSA